MTDQIDIAPEAISDTLTQAAATDDMQRQFALTRLASAMIECRMLGNLSEPAPEQQPEPQPEPEPEQESARYDYLDDLSLEPWAAGTGMTLPRIMLTETQSMEGTDEQFTKYDVIGIKAGMLWKTERVQKINPGVRVHYGFSPRDYQGEFLRDPCNLSSGIPFKSIGPATANCQVYPGHWLYCAGTRLVADVSDTQMVLRVQDTSRIKPDRWVCIYDDPPGSFANAEHARVASVDADAGTVTLEVRGHKGPSLAHRSGSIVAMHVMGRGFTDQNWAYNTSLVCPQDASGRIGVEVMADWLRDHHELKGNGQKSGTRVDGIYFDVDAYFILKDNMDVDNNLVVDEGISAEGVNLLGEGLELFYRLVRERFPNEPVVGGDRFSRGFGLIDGVQMECFPCAGGNEHTLPLYGHDRGYNQCDGNLQRYFFNLNREPVHAGYTENLSKAATALYYYKDRGGEPAPDNSPFRFALGMTLLGNGHFGQQNSKTDPDPWYDEYAVDVTRGSATYGHAIASNPQDESAICAHKGWMGLPLADPARVYDSAAFAPDRSLIANGDFSDGTEGWEITSLAHEIVQDPDRGPVLSLPRHNHYQAQQWRATVKADHVDLVAGREYTLCFAARADSIREIEAQVMPSSSVSVFFCDQKWRRYVHTFVAQQTGRFRPTLRLGREDIPMQVDDIYLFDGNANVFLREFDSGLVVVNATPSAKTIDLGGQWQRIKGTGQDDVNDGSRISSVTLPPYDAAILVRVP